MRRMSMETSLALEDAGRTADAHFEALLELHRPRVLRFILASVRNRETAENLTQDCLLRAYKARGRFRGEAAFATWLMSIAANVVRSHESRSRLKFWRRALRPVAGAAEERGPAADWFPGREMSPEEIALAKEQVAAVWRAAAQLPERQRTVFLLRFVEDMELLDISAVTGMKEGTVKTHLFRALKSVRSALGERQ
jgi:RNA polymerase sigma-70 factor (ECF subfamily)